MDNRDEMFEALEHLLEGMKAINAAAKRVISDRLSTPIGHYNIQTGPNPFSDGEWVTVLAVETDSGKTFGPVGAQEYPSEQEAKTGHYEWRKLICECPPMILKDAKTGEVTLVTP